ncbi:MAG TPA: nucleotide sugar dehydrogenase [Chloroflexota bacterium]
MSTICVLGLGYIGLPSASMFATQGYDVVGVDVNPAVVEALRSGKVHIQEPGLNMLVQSATQSGKLRVQMEPERAEAFIIAVPTPLSALSEDGIAPRPDLTYVRSATESIAPLLEEGNLVILESTSPPGTTEHLVRPILEQSGLRAGSDFSLAYCAERVLPGRILIELVTNDRIVGGIDRVSAQRAKDLYRSFVEGQVLKTDATTAEMVKLMENTYRDVNIALANEFSRVASQVGVDVNDAISFANHHPRVNVLRPGPGVGGHCIAVDPWFIVDAAPDDTPLIRTAREINDAQPYRVADLVTAVVADLERPTIAALGMAYKADVDDVRESPSIDVVRILRDRGYSVRAHDALAASGPESVTFERDMVATLDGADVMVILTDHTVYRELDPHTAGPGAMAHKRIVDTRACLDRSRWQSAGFTVERLGVRGSAPGALQAAIANGANGRAGGA